MEILHALDTSDGAAGDSVVPPTISQRIVRRTKFVLGISDSRNVAHELPLTHTNPNGTDNLVQNSLNLTPSEPERYVCACFPGTTYKKYLHHVDANKARTDPLLFRALQRKYFDSKPLWKRILVLRTLARVEYFEVNNPPPPLSAPE